LHAASYYGNYTIAKYLIDKGADVNIRSAPGENETPLTLAARGGHMRICALLVAEGADINATEHSVGYSALHEAVDKGNINLIKLLISKGADVDLPARYGETPLHLIVNPTLPLPKSEEPALEMMKVLIDAGADLNAVDHGGMTPLMWASYHDRLGIAEYLFEHGADVNYTRDLGDEKTALEHAKSEEMKNLLIKHGASGTHGATPKK
jgi:ankyrin repeat protein